MQLTFLLILVTISLGSCTVLPQNSISPPPPTVSVTQISPSKVATSTATETTLQIENFNPSNRSVELSELDLKPTTRMLMFDPKSEQILSVSDQSIDPLTNIQSENNILSDGIRMSPDNRWFAYLEIDEGFQIWISSVDGTQHFLGIKNAIGSTFRWLNNEKIVVYNKVGFWLDCPSEMQIVDPFSKEVIDISDISTQGSQYCFPIPYFKPDFSQALYLNSETGWEVFDYKTRSSYSVLPGLDNSPSSNKYFFHWGKDGLSFAIPESDKITFAFDLPEATFTTGLTLNRVALPDGTVNEDALFATWIPEEQIVGLDLIGSDNKTVLGCNVRQTYVMINLKTRKLNNYCLDRSLFSDQVGTPWFTYISDDYRFIGWTIRKLPSNEDPLGAVILDTETGKLSYLEGYEFLGFGELEQ